MKMHSFSHDYFSVISFHVNSLIKAWKKACKAAVSSVYTIANHTAKSFGRGKDKNRDRDLHRGLFVVLHSLCDVCLLTHVSR